MGDPGSSHGLPQIFMCCRSFVHLTGAADVGKFLNLQSIYMDVFESGIPYTLKMANYCVDILPSGNTIRANKKKKSFAE